MNRRSFAVALTVAIRRAQNQTAQPSPPTQLSAASPGGGPPTYTVAGTVVNASNHAPIGKALVQIAVTVRGGENRRVVTGPDGRFSFSNVPANKYALTVTRQSGAPQAYLANGGFSSAIVMGPDQDTSNILFLFHMPGTIAGTVTDENGQPVHNGQIHLFAHVIDDQGNRILAPQGGNSTRSSGQFRLPHLQPGSYILAVSGQPWFAQRNVSSVDASRGGVPLAVREPDPQFDVVYPLTYYPSAAEPGTASPISVVEGSETTIQMMLRAVPSIHVKLVAGDSKPGVAVSVQAWALAPGSIPMPSGTGGFLQNGQGELSGLTAGHYQLTWTSFSLPPPGSSPETIQGRFTGRGEFSRKVVDLVDGATVDLTASSHVSVKATVALAGNDRPMNRIGLRLRDRKSINSVAAMAGEDGNLRFPEANLSPGRYQVSLSNTPEFRILSLEAKGAKVVGDDILIEDNADVQLALTIGRRSSTRVEGYTVRDDQAVVGAMVLLLPKSPGLGATVYRDQSDSDGSFGIAGVPTGTYRVIAIDNGREFAFGDPAVIKPYLPSAQVVTVTESRTPAPLKISVQTRIA